MAIFRSLKVLNRLWVLSCEEVYALLLSGKSKSPGSSITSSAGGITYRLGMESGRPPPAGVQTRGKRVQNGHVTLLLNCCGI